MKTTARWLKNCSDCYKQTDQSSQCFSWYVRDKIKRLTLDEIVGWRVTLLVPLTGASAGGGLIVLLHFLFLL
jgi:hypothetical protein